MSGCLFWIEFLVRISKIIPTKLVSFGRSWRAFRENSGIPQFSWVVCAFVAIYFAAGCFWPFFVFLASVVVSESESSHDSVSVAWIKRCVQLACKFGARVLCVDSGGGMRWCWSVDDSASPAAGRHGEDFFGRFWGAHVVCVDFRWVRFMLCVYVFVLVR